MLEKLARRIASYFVKMNVAKEEDEELYIYGLQTILSSVFSILFIGLLSIIFGKILESIIYLSSFILLRRYTGGYHAKKYWTCFCITVISYIINMVIGHYIIEYGEYLMIYLLFFICIIVIVLLAPIANKNRPIAESQIGHFKKINRCLCIFFTILCVILNILHRTDWSVYIVLSVITTGITLFIGMVENH